MATELNSTHSVANPRTDLTPEFVRSRYEYEPHTGVISNKRNGRRVGFEHSSGYRHIEISGLHRKEHRIAWLIYYGEWPTGQIDHINGNKSDNRIANLRDVDGTTNQFNTGLSVKNKTGVKGVCLRPSGKYEARIRYRGKQLSLGFFTTIEEAKCAYETQKAKLPLK